MDSAILAPAEETADSALQLSDYLGGVAHQGPRQLLVIDVGPPGDGVLEVELQGVPRVEDGVVSALNQARAAALAAEPLDGHHHSQAWLGIGGMKGGEEARAATAKDEDVGLKLFHDGLRARLQKGGFRAP